MRKTPQSDPDLPPSASSTPILPPAPRSAHLTRKPARRLSKAELEQILGGLEVSFVKLTECLISDGWRLQLDPVDLPGLHYVLAGNGTMTFENGESASLSPHTLVIQPSGQEARVDVPGVDAIGQRTSPQDLLKQIGDGNTIPRRFVAGDGAPTLIFICGYFRVQHGGAVDLFKRLTAPIVEAFATGDGLDSVLREATAELLRQDLGAGVMTSALMKRVLVQLFRRALMSTKAWVDNLAILGDEQISRAFSEIVARPGDNHSVHTLAQTAGLSRSIFMARFSALFGQSPMAVLRDLRMRRAAFLLATDNYQVDQVAHLVGYANRSSFCRAFYNAHGHYPSVYQTHERERLKRAAVPDD